MFSENNASNPLPKNATIIATCEVDMTAYEVALRSKRTVLVNGAGFLFSGTYYAFRVFRTITHEEYIQRFELKRNVSDLKLVHLGEMKTLKEKGLTRRKKGKIYLKEEWENNCY